MPFNFPVAPPAASTFAKEYDAIFYTLCALTVLFSLIVGIAVVYLAIKYRAGSNVDRSRPVYEDLRLELTWTIIPLILGLVMFGFGARLFVHLRTPPKNASEIFVIGKQWMWHAMHPNGTRENNTLHVPVGRPVKITMISQDVLHAFYIPAFRTQMHTVPGRYTTLWFEATQTGEFHLFCNMYCGTQHSEMGGKVVALEPREYEEWLANGGTSSQPMTMEQSGQKIFNSVGCNNCHGGEDTLRGPSLKNIYGTKRTFSNSGPVVADEAYLRESILNPANKLTAGYGQTMSAYEGQLSEEEIINLIAYIKSGAVTPVPSGETSRRQATNKASGNDTRNSLAVGAMRGQTEDPDATPTVRNNNPAVGAIAAQGRTQ